MFDKKYINNILDKLKKTTNAYHVILLLLKLIDHIASSIYSDNPEKFSLVLTEIAEKLKEVASQII